MRLSGGSFGSVKGCRCPGEEQTKVPPPAFAPMETWKPGLLTRGGEASGLYCRRLVTQAVYLHTCILSPRAIAHIAYQIFKRVGERLRIMSLYIYKIVTEWMLALDCISS